MNDFSRASIGERIRRIRFTDVTVHVSARDGSPLCGEDVAIEQTAHTFFFGQTGMELVGSPATESEESKEKLRLFKERTKELFNAVTLPFYWGRFEPEEGRPKTTEVMEAARWFKENGFTVKGHPLCWHSMCADWLMKYSNEEILQKQRARIRREVSDFAGLIDTWDVINEPVIMPVYDKHDNGITRIAVKVGAIPLADMLLREARVTNPKATLLVNDFDLGPDYERVIESLLERSAPIDAIGLQTHQHQGYLGARAIWDCAERFSRFGLPLHFTENTLVSGHLMPAQIVDLNDYKVDDWPTTPEGEERQRDEVTELYSLLYSHPAVHAITWWGLPDGGWLKAPSGLLRQDMSPKPAYRALRDLIKGEWWTAKRHFTTGADGLVQLRCTSGTFRISARGTEARFTVSQGAKEIAVRLVEPSGTGP